MSGIVFVYVTHPNAEAALAMGRLLVEERLAACANVLPGMRSVYRWEGAVEEAEEAVMILKTRADCVARLEARIRDGHPYEVPCVVVLPVAGGSAAYLAWVAGSCGLSLRGSQASPG